MKSSLSYTFRILDAAFRINFANIRNFLFHCSFPCNKYPATQKKGHSPEISFKKVTLLGLISIAEFYLNNLSSLIITCDSIRICCQFVVKIISKSPQTRINTGFIYQASSLSGCGNHTFHVLIQYSPG